MRLWLALFLLAPGARAAVPKEARRHFLKAAAIQKGAQQPADYELAAAEYRKALGLAPKYAAARYNLALALESEGSFDEAIAELRKYETLRPAEKDAVEDKIAGIEGKKELAANRAAGSADSTPASPQMTADEKLLAKIDGAVYTMHATDGPPAMDYDITVRGGKATFTTRFTPGPSSDNGTGVIEGRHFTLASNPGTLDGYISADGESIDATEDQTAIGNSRVKWFFRRR